MNHLKENPKKQGQLPCGRCTDYLLQVTVVCLSARSLCSLMFAWFTCRIAETLTELYGQSAYEASTQPAYLNPSSQQPYYEEEPVPMGTYMTWQEAQEHYRRQWGTAVAYNDPYEVRGAYGTPHYGGRS